MKMGIMILLAFLGSNAVTDLNKREILLLPTLVYSFVLLWVNLVTEENLSFLLLSCVPGMFVLGLALVSKGGIGPGDGWILLAMGLQLGFYPVLGILWAALVLLCGFLLVLLVAGKIQENEKLTFPLVPFLFMATLLWEVLGI